MIERPEGPEPTVAPYGSWASPIRLDDIVGEVIGIGEPSIDGDDTYWLEGRPAEGGRRILVRSGIDGNRSDRAPGTL